MSASAKRPITLSRIPLKNMPTQSQALCLRTFARLKDRLGRVPTFAEISEAMGLATVTGCQKHMRLLVEKNLLTPRTIIRTGDVITIQQSVTAAGERWL